MKKIFITATDTDAGKTHIAQAVVHKLVRQGKSVAVYKPISAGCSWENGQLMNEDAILLMAQANLNQSYYSVNPVAFEQPIAPHIAANISGDTLSIKDLVRHYRTLTSLNADVIVTEGAGGWRLPLGNGHYLSALVQQTQQKVILIVNMKLGCLNHALLTAETIEADGVALIGWVANVQNDMPYLKENIDELRQLLSCPFLGEIGFEADISQVASQIDLSVIF